MRRRNRKPSCLVSDVIKHDKVTHKHSPFRANIPAWDERDSCLDRRLRLARLFVRMPAAVKLAVIRGVKQHKAKLTFLAYG